ncbi:MAG: hypothetical protein CMF51_03010 [Legionellales bacterium]|nr:hypothetical protein [Legionellales bacterium]|tara:strand:- start:84 stop:923 length:840 start_codon:yes stop_codon:yes gene_type:complete
MNELQQRMRSAIVLIIGLLCVVYGLKAAAIWITALLVGYGVFEWLCMQPAAVARMSALKAVSIALIFLGMSIVYDLSGSDIRQVYQGVMLWMPWINMILITLVLLYFKCTHSVLSRRWSSHMECVHAMILMSCFGFSLLELWRLGPTLLIWNLSLVGLTDSMAYLIGKRWGRYHCFAPISPGKTFEGTCGAVIVTMLFAIISLPVLHHGGVRFVWQAAILGGVAAWGAVVGDLWESALKRRCGVKDSGTLIPGHGGVLDRIDGLIIAVPMMAALWQIWV